MSAVEVVADRMTGTVRVELPREAIAGLLVVIARDSCDFASSVVGPLAESLYALADAQDRCDLPDRELADRYDLTRDEADNRLSEALDAVLGLLPPTVWTMTAERAFGLALDLQDRAKVVAGASRVPIILGEVR